VQGYKSEAEMGCARGDSGSGRRGSLRGAQNGSLAIEAEKSIPSVVSRETVSRERQALDDTDFIAGWADATLPKFQSLHGGIDQLRRRDPKIFLPAEKPADA